jgi:hypothetical protein
VVPDRTVGRACQSPSIRQPRRDSAVASRGSARRLAGLRPLAARAPATTPGPRAVLAPGRARARRRTPC